MAGKPAFDIDCKRLFKLYSHQVSVNFSFLDKIKAEFKISSEKIGEVNSWTTFALAELYSECSIFRATGKDDDKTSFRNAEKDLPDWLEEMARILAPYKQVFDDAQKGKPVDDPTKNKVKNDVEKGLDKGIEKGKKAPTTATLKPALASSNLLDVFEKLQAPLPSVHEISTKATASE